MLIHQILLTCAGGANVLDVLVLVVGFLDLEIFDGLVGVLFADGLSCLGHMGMLMVYMQGNQL